MSWFIFCRAEILEMVVEGSVREQSKVLRKFIVVRLNKTTPASGSQNPSTPQSLEFALAGLPGVATLSSFDLFSLAGIEMTFVAFAS
jgi:hypothetical protein